MYSEANLTQHPSITWPLCIKIPFVSPSTQIQDKYGTYGHYLQQCKSMHTEQPFATQLQAALQLCQRDKADRATVLYSKIDSVASIWCLFFITRQNVVQTCKQWTHLRSLIPGRIKNGSIHHNFSIANTSGTGERYRWEKGELSLSRQGEKVQICFGTHGEKQ